MFGFKNKTHEFRGKKEGIWSYETLIIQKLLSFQLNLNKYLKFLFNGVCEIAHEQVCAHAVGTQRQGWL